MTNEDIEKINNAPFPRYIYSTLPNGGVAIIRQTDPLTTEQTIIPEQNFVELVKQWKDIRKRESLSKIEIARTMPSKGLVLVD